MNETRAWWKEAVVYQIYPRSFMDSNGDGIGDLNGITQRLDYLAELGIDVIWLSPVYQSPNDDNGYDISDYRAILDEFGTMADFDAMLAKANRLGIRIVMDLVVNHTSDEHAWFIESRKSKDNPYRDYYIWKDPTYDAQGNRRPPNNWGSCFSGSAWKYDETTDQYYLHLFSPKQPDLNWENPTVREEVYDMMRFWLDKGISGFRMDVISLISKDPSYADGAITPNGYTSFDICANGPRVHEFLQEMRQKALSGYDTLTVGECSGVTVEEAKRYANQDGSELNMVFQFEHMDVDAGPLGKWCEKPLDLCALRDILSRWQTELEGKAWNSLFWCNHDQPRVVSRFGDNSPKSAKMLATCLHFLKGTPYVYQGEELGMTNVPFASLEDFRDLESLNAYHELVGMGKIDGETMFRCLLRKSRDNARTPMQWDDSPNAGFSTGTPWIMVNPNYKTINAAAEQADPDSVFHYYQTLIALRKANPIMVYGRYAVAEPANSPAIWAYTRTLDDTQLLVVCNFTDAQQPFALPGGYEDASVLIANTAVTLRPDMTLQPWDAFVLVKSGI